MDGPVRGRDAGRDTHHEPVDGAIVLRATSPKVASMLILVAITPLLDLATFLPAVARVGIHQESNPLARELFLLHGPAGLAALKIAAIGIMLLALWRVGRRFPSFLLPTAVIVVAVESVGIASNVVFGLLR